MEFNIQIYDTVKEWQTAESLAHKTLVNLKGYTSDRYASNPIETTDNKFILVELTAFSKQLLKAGFLFEKGDKSIIKQDESIA
jgi:hypothetical protein